jgi:hypothetical protein
MAAVAAVQRLKEGSDAILKAALEQRDRPSHTQVPQSLQERLAAEAMAAAREVDDILEHAKLACAAESDEEVQREVCSAVPFAVLMQRLPSLMQLRILTYTLQWTCTHS